MTWPRNGQQGRLSTSMINQREGGLKMKMGDKVTWNTGGINCTAPSYQRTGEVTEVVPGLKIPATYTDGNYSLATRNHESYVVTVENHRYWPRVKALKTIS